MWKQFFIIMVMGLSLVSLLSSLMWYVEGVNNILFSLILLWKICLPTIIVMTFFFWEAEWFIYRK
jgi:hypothetical protein